MVWTYSSSTSSCRACPESTESPPGSTDVSSCLTSCEPGYTGPAGSCTACDVGKYKNSSGSSPCTTCPQGHVSYDGESSCRACVPGKYAPGYGYNCFYCPTGKYSSTFAALDEAACQCVFITAGPITKLFAGGGGGEWTTCAMIDDEPRPVWMSPLVTH